METFADKNNDNDLSKIKGCDNYNFPILSLDSEYNGDLNTDHSNYEIIWKPTFLKFGFQMVLYLNGQFMLCPMYQINHLNTGPVHNKNKIVVYYLSFLIFLSRTVVLYPPTIIPVLNVQLPIFFYCKLDVIQVKENNAACCKNKSTSILLRWSPYVWYSNGKAVLYSIGIQILDHLAYTSFWPLEYLTSLVFRSPLYTQSFM